MTWVPAGTRTEDRVLSPMPLAAIDVELASTVRQVPLKFQSLHSMTLGGGGSVTRFIP